MSSVDAIATNAALEEASALLLSGDLLRARSTAEWLVANDPNEAAAWNLLGVLELREGHLGEAILALERAIELGPLLSAPWRNLAMAHATRPDWNSAEAVLARAVEALPKDADLQKLFAKAALECKHYENALGAYHRAHCLSEDDKEAALGIARALKALRRYTGAAEVLEAIVESDPHDPTARALLADVYALDRKTHLVLEHREEVFRLQPQSMEAQIKLSTAWWDVGDLSRSLDLVKPVVDAGSATPAVHSFYLSALVHLEGQSAQDIRNAHERWGEVHYQDIQPFRDWPNDRDPNRKLRVAYIGGDFFDNPSYHFLLPYFRHCNRDQFELYGFDVRDRGDHATSAFRKASDQWRCVSKWSDGQIVDQIRKDKIDILIDTTGHHDGNRLRLMLYRAAPVQIAMLNYPATTGLHCYDGIVADPWVCPTGSERQYTETALPIPSGYLPYDPPATAPDVSPLPALRNGFITFGLFQRPVKLGTEGWDAIAAVLERTAGSQLLIHNAFRQLAANASPMRALYIREFEARGIDRSRLRFEGPAGMDAHLRILAQCDIALDTFPYNGQTTTCECLWMGIPVVTITGAYHVARVGRSILHRAGYPEWEAHSPLEYIEKACALASDLQRLAESRLRMRPRVAASLLVDGAAVTRELESALRVLWARWCEKEFPNYGG